MRRGRDEERSPRVRARGELVAPPGADVIVTAAMGTAGPVAIWASTNAAQQLGQWYEGPGGASFPVTQPSDEPPVALVSYDNTASISDVVICEGLTVAHPLVDRFADGSILVVGARCEWLESGPEQNALIIGTDGGVERRGCIGDGLQHVQVGPDGTIWTGYFDEGIFGNLGWGGPGPTPLGAAGIVSWSRSFEKVWELDPSEGLIADCYALNVGADAVLACTYTDFPVVRIDAGQAAMYPTVNVSGPRGIVASGDRVGIVGTYRDPSVLIIGDLVGGQFVEQRRTNLWAPDGSPLPMSRVQSRGSEVHFFEGSRWFSFSIDELN